MHHLESLSASPATSRAARTRVITAQPDQLWAEHGWALGSGGVGAIIAVILAASVVAQIFG